MLKEMVKREKSSFYFFERKLCLRVVSKFGKRLDEEEEEDEDEIRPIGDSLIMNMV